MKNQISFLLITLSTMFFISSCSEDSLELEHNFETELQTTEAKPSDLTSHRNCGMAHTMEKLMSDPNYKKAHLEKLRKLALMDNNPKQRSACANPILIPMAIHYQGIANPNINCLVSLAQGQVDILNKDFAGTNNDINKWTTNASSFFPGVANGETCVKFVLADKNHPSGYDLSEGSPAVTINRSNGDRVNAFSNYLNVFVRANLGFLGESPLGGLGNGDGVLVDASAFGAGNGCGSVSPSAPYNLGRTLTHEIGHYLLLDHIWGGGCNTDDGINDTPNQNADYGGCPSLGQSSCSSTDMHMNYMDYTNDACMYMFSAGQATRMENYISSSLSNITNNASNVYGGVGSTNNDSSEDESDNEGNDNGDDIGDAGDDEPTNICDKPIGIEVTLIDTRKVTITWEASYEAIRYQIRYRKVGVSNWTRKSGTATSRTISRLVAGADYEYQLRTRCSDGWTGYTSIEGFNTVKEDTSSDDSGDATCNAITFELVLDQYGSETSWELVNADNERVANGGPYKDNQAGRKITKEFCLPNGCYTMYVDDAYGDGICCDYGDGYFTLSDQNGNTIAESNGYFGDYDYLDVCIENNSGSLRSRKTDPKSKKLARKKNLATN